MIKAIIFDVGGVILDAQDAINKNVFAPMKEALGISAEVFKTVLDEFRSPLQKSEMSEEKFFKILCKKLNIPYKEEYKDLFSIGIKEAGVNEDVKNTILSLRGKYRLGVLTNAVKSHYDYLKENGLYEPFDFVISSHLVGTRKPERKIYELAVEKSGFKPEECVFIDDVEKFATVAKDFGINGIWFKSAEQLKKDLKKLGVSL